MRFMASTRLLMPSTRPSTPLRYLASACNRSQTTRTWAVPAHFQPSCPSSPPRPARSVLAQAFRRTDAPRSADTHGACAPCRPRPWRSDAPSGPRTLPSSTAAGHPGPPDSRYAPGPKSRSPGPISCRCGVTARRGAPRLPRTAGSRRRPVAPTTPARPPVPSDRQTSAGRLAGASCDRGWARPPGYSLCSDEHVRHASQFQHQPATLFASLAPPVRNPIPLHPAISIAHGRPRFAASTPASVPDRPWTVLPSAGRGTKKKGPIGAPSSLPLLLGKSVDQEQAAPLSTVQTRLAR